MRWFDNKDPNISITLNLKILSGVQRWAKGPGRACFNDIILNFAVSDLQV